ncbi:hypothetical protein K493DRAFT_333909 [Basidiobolus meristosporus CBS 931.73]|uniref:Fucosyltransferase n=1 Tax=Basidiobolus meristosporus CBS 931.73 TaxID=1314790 RepID=A0A1Y1Z2I2_9FUNG|nr:hypothetical protein K493DRAFT_333909 [Basidiobolus meristosporus CBS 931.73]|eukprot:ORY04396.1 hypothetical protein K493DRAFT_333909 [Basidiobolus meristosporus CBS 931.73]
MVIAENIPIYYYTKWYGHDQYEGHQIDYCGLPYTCSISHKDDILRDGSAKAVMFYSSDIQRKKRTKLKFPPDADSPAWGLPWVLHSNEAPINEYWELEPALLRLFTYQMEYRLDSDFPIPYIPSDAVDTIRSNAGFDTIMRDKKNDVYVAWVVSSSEATNKRHYMVRELQKYMNVDIYGNYAPFRNKHGDGEIHDIIRKYKFYLALENSSCDEYVSEKFWNALTSTTIPVVDGPDDYGMYAPTSHSIIKIDEFKNPKALAEYLTYLANNDTAYTEYFSYKFGEPFSERFTNAWVGKNYSEQAAMCKMCKTLYENEVYGVGGEPPKHQHRMLHVEQSCRVGKWEEYRFTFYTSGWFVWIWPLAFVMLVVGLYLFKRLRILSRVRRSCTSFMPKYTAVNDSDPSEP